MKSSLSIRAANVLFLVTILLVLLVGSTIQVLNLPWGLIGTEFLLILLPTLIFLKVKKVSFKEGLRLNPITWQVALICIGLGLAAWLFDAYIDTLVMQLSGLPPVQLAAGMAPDSVLEGIVFFVALAIAAPLCEEALFRGAIQTAYEKQRSPLFAVVITALMFAFYHFRPTGLLALLPIAFILGWVMLRTQSLWAVMLVHFGNNAFSGGITLASLVKPGITFNPISIYSAAGGLVVIVVLLVLLRRLTATRAAEAPVVAAVEPVEEPATEAAELAPLKREPGRVALYWPLAVVLVLFIANGVLTAYITQNPPKGITFTGPADVQSQTYKYRLLNRANDEIGLAQCQIDPAGESLKLTCANKINGYEITVGQSMWSDATHASAWSAEWDASSLAVKDYSYTFVIKDGGGWQADLDNGQLVVEFQGEEQEPVQWIEGALLQDEWAWRLPYANLSAGQSATLDMGYPMRWDVAMQNSAPRMVSEILRVNTVAEKLTVPAGEFDAIKVTLGDRAAWYTVNDPMYLLKYDDGMTVYELMK